MIKFSKSRNLKEVLGLRKATRLRAQKAQELYLDYLIRRDYRKPEVRTIMYCMDQGFPKSFIFELFEKKPELVSSFIPPFTLGYGSHTPLLFELLQKYKNSQPGVMMALVYAFENRRKPHFYRIENELISFFEVISGIEYRGDDSVFRKWYRNKKR